MEISFVTKICMIGMLWPIFHRIFWQILVMVSFTMYEFYFTDRNWTKLRTLRTLRGLFQKINANHRIKWFIYFIKSAFITFDKPTIVTMSASQGDKLFSKVISVHGFFAPIANWTRQHSKSSTFATNSCYS